MRFLSGEMTMFYNWSWWCLNNIANILKATEWYTLSGLFVYWFLLKAVHVYCVVPRKSVISVYSLIPRLNSPANTEISLGNFLFNTIFAIALKQAFYNNEHHLAVPRKSSMCLRKGWGFPDRWKAQGVRLAFIIQTSFGLTRNDYMGLNFEAKMNSLCGSSFWMIGSALVTATEVMVFMPFSAISHRDFK